MCVDDLENHWEQHDVFGELPSHTKHLLCEVEVTVNGKNLMVDAEYELEIEWSNCKNKKAIERWDECWCSVSDEKLIGITNITDDNGGCYTPTPEEVEQIKNSLPALTDRQKMEACEDITI